MKKSKSKKVGLHSQPIELKLPFNLVQKSKLKLKIEALGWDKQAIRSRIKSKHYRFSNFRLSFACWVNPYYYLEILNQFKCMKDCGNPGVYISPDSKTILCEVHKNREKDHHGYVRHTQIGNHLDLLLDQLELMFIDFQTCLAIVDMLLKEKKALQVDYNDLKSFNKVLEDEMNKLNDWFSGGTFRLQ
jgi:hypothetical protein